MIHGLAHYRLLRALGEGGQADVFLAVDTRLQRRVCIKLYRYDGGLRERLRVQQEAWRLAALASPQIVDIIEVIAHRGRLALITRYVPGASLAQLLRCEECLEAAAALAVASDLASAFAALGRAGFVHGDLSAANVVVNDQGRALLIDFGASICGGGKALAVSDEACTPEQLRGEPLGPTSDFFALGLLLHRMLTGRHPFLREGGIDRGELQRGLRVPPELPAVPEAARPALQALLQWLLAASPRQRPPNVAALREALQKIRHELSPPRGLGARAVAAGRQALRPGGAPRLPKSLLRLPLRRQLAAGLRRYWASGSGGARALLLLALAAPPVAAALMLARPGPCLSVAAPSAAPGAAQLLAVSDYRQLHRRITTIVKELAPGALVLGEGTHSDSRRRLSGTGVRDICVPQGELALSVGCDRGGCRLAGVARAALDTRRVERVLAADASQREFRSVLDEVVAGQLAYLMK
ncbi:MAG: serine/threonine-protein kinase [Halieaceae bacterium]|jgi:serine/threonine-protein kinase|nr:serine/threonine-protein kinase [Halieaceae bacterium]